MKFVVWSRGQFLGALFACGYSGVRVAALFEKLAHCVAFVVKVGVVTTGASQQKLREWNVIFNLLWMKGPMQQILMSISSLNFVVYDSR